ncbi:DNA polymerase eta-like [Saccoglossus kowalevskii]|uniref:DNA polymerase eta-like n=1 Tax=Saccoglossus kowalevskii TaxID=10224 RepID=A0ABM0GZH5_SACKO|nr:PREDICTED: DNA polymerase eta-like [Saccoglossus kowalevskii]
MTRAWLHDVGRGIDNEPVRPRQLPKSVGCGKNFSGKLALATRNEVKYWLLQLATEMEERLQIESEMNKRVAKSVSVQVRWGGNPPQTASRSFGLHNMDADTISRNALSVIQCFNTAGNHQKAWCPAIITLSMCASKFTETGNNIGKMSISSFFSGKEQSTSTVNGSNDGKTTVSSSFNGKKEVISTEKKVTSRSQLDEFSPKESKKKRKSIDSFFSASQRLKRDSDAADFIIMPSSSGYQEKPSSIDKQHDTMTRTNLNHSTGFFASKMNQPVTSSLNSDPLVDACHEQNTGVYASDKPNNFKQQSVRDPSPGIIEVTSLSLSRQDKDLTTCSDKLFSDLPVADFVTCEKCQQKVSAWDLPEHLDYHYAFELQEQIDIGSTTSTARTIETPVKTSKSTPSTLYSFFQKKT